MFPAIPTQSVSDRTENLTFVNITCILFIFGFYSACLVANVPCKLFTVFSFYSIGTVLIAELMEARAHHRVAQWLVYAAYALCSMSVFAITIRLIMVYCFHE